MVQNGHERLRTMVTLFAAAFLAAVAMGERAKLRLLAEYLLRSSRRMYRVPAVRYYALADGIKKHLFSSQRRPSPPLLRPGDRSSCRRSGEAGESGNVLMQ